jgi:two-component system LytT family response regulator
MLKKLKAYIVDDDILNIELLKFLINKCNPNISIIGEATSTNDLVGLMLENKADILFLDIDLGEEKTALDILSDFNNIKAEIIITSSSKEYALKALNEFGIFSYILKPLNVLSLNKVLIKLKKKLELEEKTLNNPI